MSEGADVTIVDYGLGNLFNVKRALQTVGAENAEITSDPSKILSAKRLILPGVGAFAEGMAGLKARNLVEPLREYAGTGRPFMGICLGMQLMMERSEELGVTEGLGIIPGEVVLMKAKSSENLKIPHIGWNELKPARPTLIDTLLAGIPSAADQTQDPTTSPITLYFLHSFVAVPKDPNWILAKTTYGSVEFVSALARGKLVGFQPHLERSGPHGLAILRNFLRG